MDKYEQMLEDINEQMTSLQKINRLLFFKLEDQENQSPRKNLRISGIPEKYKNYELIKVMQELFNPILERETAETLKMDRVHRTTSYQMQADDSSRDVIARFDHAEEQSKIMEGIRTLGGI